MKHLLILVMIISLLLTAVGCSNGLVSSKDDLSGGDKPAQETTPETSPGQIEPEENNPDNTDGQGQNEPEPPEVEKPEVEQLEVVPPPINETPEVIPPEVKPPVDPPTVEPPETEPPEVIPPIVEPPEVEPPETEPPEVIPPVVEIPRNDLIINELRTEYSFASKRAEFIEFKVMNACNLSGISVHIMNKEKNHFVYNFPNIDVSKGEYITLHLQTLESNCKDELGNNLALSGGTDSCPTARDLWAAGNDEHLNPTDIVYLKDSDGKIIDAVVLNKQPSSKWEKSLAHFEQIMEFLFNEGVWGSKYGEKPTPYDAVDTSLITNINRSVCRYEGRENHFNAADWYISGIGNFTPGLPNN